MPVIRAFSPTDPQDGGTPTGSTSSAGGLPLADVSLMTVADAVATKWTATPEFKLLWMTATQFAALAAAYRTALTARTSSGANRPGQSQALRALDVKVNDAVREVKTYVDKKFGSKNGAAQYPRYGIVKESTTYRLSADRDARLEAMDMMMSALETDGLGDEQYGTTFWNDLKKDYDSALKASNLTDATVSTGSAAKNELKRDLRKVITALRYVLRGNYPDDYAAQYRAWGMQKEDY